jgi:hypothetical protein
VFYLFIIIIIIIIFLIFNFFFVHQQYVSCYLIFILGLFFILLVVLDIQVGCPLRCSFCATGKGGFSRNLKRHEIIEQVLLINVFLYLLFIVPLCGSCL